MPSDQETNANQLLGLITILLTPLFLELTGNDINQAWAAAAATINEYRARTGMEVLLIAQIIAFSIAGISTVVESQQPDLQPDVAMKLQAKANSLSRTADTARKALENARRRPPPPMDHEREAVVLARVAELANADPAASMPCSSQPEPPSPAPQPLARQPSVRPAASADPVAPIGHTPIPHAPSPAPGIWAATFTKVAQEIAASLPHLPPEQRPRATTQMAALTEVAHELRAQSATPPAA